MTNKFRVKLTQTARESITNLKQIWNQKRRKMKQISLQFNWILSSAKHIILKKILKTIPKSVKRFSYITCHIVSSTRHLKRHLNNSTTCKYQKILSQTRRHKTTLEIRKITHLPRSSTKLLFKSLRNILLTGRRFITMQQFLCLNLSQTFIKKKSLLRYSISLENKISSNMYWKDWLIWEKIQANSPSELSFKYNQNQTSWRNQKQLSPI